MVCVTGNVRKAGMMKIVHEKYKITKKIVDPMISEFHMMFENAIEYNKELGNLINKAQVWLLGCKQVCLSYSLTLSMKIDKHVESVRVC